MLCLVWFLPVEFSACSIDSLWCGTAYWLTESAGKYGTLLIIVLAAFLYTLRIKSKKEKIITFFSSAAALFIILAVFAYTNEHFTKKILKYPRPSHTYIISQSGQKVNLDSMYKLEIEQRKEFLHQLIISSTVLTATIDKKVLDHWVEEAGYSFPSGHSFNAFLLACILSFSIYHSRYKKLVVIPFVWALSIAVSRVAIGAHSALDVSVGAALGILIAMLLLYFDTTRKLITRKKNVV